MVVRAHDPIRLEQRSARPGAEARIKVLMDRRFHEPSDVENRLGY